MKLEEFKTLDPDKQLDTFYQLKKKVLLSKEELEICEWCFEESANPEGGYPFWTEKTVKIHNEEYTIVAFGWTNEIAYRHDCDIVIAKPE